MREECHSKLIRHDTVELAINCIDAQYPAQFGFHVSNRSQMDSDHRSFVRRSRQPPDLVEMSRLKE